MMLKSFLFIVGSMAVILNGAVYDSGYGEVSQPNNEYSFVMRHTLDDFYWEMITEEGYAIIQEPDGYYYYAILDGRGEYISSTQKVGIDAPVQESFNLERSPERILEIEAEKQEWISEMALYYQERMQTHFIEDGVIRLGILLVEFDDLPHLYDINKNVWDNMIFSENAWHGAQAGHESGLTVYGSLNNYLQEQSNDNYILKGRDGISPEIINPLDPENEDKPKWLRIHESYANYTTIGPATTRATAAAVEAGLIPENPYEIYDVVGFIFAGGEVEMKGRTKKFTVSEHYLLSQIHVGPIAHEFMHAAFGVQHDDSEYLSLGQD